MFVVIFEAQPKPDRGEAYLEQARLLRPEIERIDGFIDNERFRDRRDPRRLVSLSTWRDEKAVVRWRTQARHRQSQELGRFEVFEDYHLRVGEVTADSHVPTGQIVREQRLDETEIGQAKAVTLTEIPPDPAVPDPLAALALPGAESAGMTEAGVFESLTNEGKLLALGSWRDAAAAAAWRPALAGVRHRRVRVIRDYGMRDRREAPQFYPEVR
jgi:heme-degrading monooxygenase HmoA